MSKTLTARLDDDTESVLKELVKKSGKSESEVVRESIVLMKKTYSTNSKKKNFIGLGKFTSGLDDLGSNKKHLKIFGK